MQPHNDMQPYNEIVKQLRSKESELDTLRNQKIAAEDKHMAECTNLEMTIATNAAEYVNKEMYHIAREQMIQTELEKTRKELEEKLKEINAINLDRGTHHIINAQTNKLPPYDRNLQAETESYVDYVDYVASLTPKVNSSESALPLKGLLIDRGGGRIIK